MPGEAVQRALAGALDVAYVEHGPATGTAVVLLHGFPYDVHAYQEVAPVLAGAGCRVVVPYLRGFGPTTFVDPAAMRSGQQAALGRDLLDLLDALDIDQAVLAGYDWGGRAACIVAALWPQRVRGLVTCGGYNVQDIARAARPAPPEAEHKLWYQYYFHGERGRAGLDTHRRALCRLLWELWSPSWPFTDADFERSAPAFDNPDFVAVVVHSYRHRFGLVPGDPELEPVEEALAAAPPIAVAAMVLEGDDNGVAPARPAAAHTARFTGPFGYERLAGVGHAVPQEAPAAFAAAVLGLLGLSA